MQGATLGRPFLQDVFRVPRARANKLFRGRFYDSRQSSPMNNRCDPNGIRTRRSVLFCDRFLICNQLINSYLRIRCLFSQNLKRSPKGTKIIEICHVLSRHFIAFDAWRPAVHEDRA